MANWIVFVEEKSTNAVLGGELELFPGGGSPGITGAVAPGDGAALLRPGPGGGIVAHGRVRVMGPPEQPDQWKRYIRYYRRTVRLDTFYLDNPITYDALRGLTPWARMPFQPGARQQETSPKVPNDAWQAILKLADQARHPSSAGSWNIPPGATVMRPELHTAFGGQRRGRATASGRTPNVFVFIDDAHPIPGTQHRWSDDGALVVSGGRSPVRVLRDEHYAVLTHLRHGRPLRLFRMNGTKTCTYLGEFVIDQDTPIEQWVPAGRQEVRHPRLPRTACDMVVPMFRVYPVHDLSAFVQVHGPLPAGSREVLRLRLEVTHLRPTARQDQAAPAPAAMANLPDEPAGESPEAAAIRRVLAVMQAHPQVADAVAEMGEAAMLTELIQRRARQVGLDELRTVVDDPGSTEHDIQHVLQRHAWVFGGQYTGRPLRRRLTARDELDLVLVRSDGTLHGVELKQAYVPDLLARRRHRNGYPTVGRRVFDAFTQAMNYLRSLDEHRDQILADFDVDCRRMTMTVLIGHPRFVPDSFSPADVADALRTFNAEHARIQILTYHDLITAAQRSLDLSAEEPTGRTTRPRRSRAQRR